MAARRRAPSAPFCWATAMSGGMLSAGVGIVRGQEGVVEVELADGRAVRPRRPLGVDGGRSREAEERRPARARVGQGHGARGGDGRAVERGQGDGRVVDDAAGDHLGDVGVDARAGPPRGERGELPGELGLAREARGRRVDPDPMDLHPR